MGFMKIFDKEPAKIKDMSDVDVRQAIIDEQISNELPPPQSIPPVGVDEFLKSKKLNELPNIPDVPEVSKDIAEEEDTDIGDDIKVTIILNTNSRRLVVSMIDGITEITHNYGASTIEEFKMEKLKK